MGRTRAVTGGRLALPAALALAGLVLLVAATPGLALAPRYGKGRAFCNPWGGVSTSGVGLANVFPCANPNISDQFGYQCVELSERFEWAVYGKAPVGTGIAGRDVVADYHQQDGVPMASPGRGRLPAPGDVVSMWGDANQDYVGHTGVVASVSAPNGNGSIALYDENGILYSDESSGVSTINVNNWQLSVPWNAPYHYTRFTWTVQGTGGAPPDGTFVRVHGAPQVFRIAGGAPLYVSSWTSFGGRQPVDVISRAQFDALASVPADGTFIRDSSNGNVYRIAGGAPFYVSSWSAFGGRQPYINVDHWDFANITNRLSHLNSVAAPGTFVRDVSTGQVYRIAGGAPLYVSSWSAFGGRQANVNIDHWNFAHITSPLAHMDALPADGTFIRDLATGEVYRIAGGGLFYVSSWSVFGGRQPYVNVDHWDIAYKSDPRSHLRPWPRDGTVVEGLPSDSYWSFESGRRRRTAAQARATTVDDVGLDRYTPAM